MDPNWKLYAAGFCFAVALVAVLVDRARKKKG